MGAAMGGRCSRLLSALQLLRGMVWRLQLLQLLRAAAPPSPHLRLAGHQQAAAARVERPSGRCQQVPLPWSRRAE